MDQESLKSILILGRLPLRLLGIEHVHRFLIGPRFRIQITPTKWGRIKATNWVQLQRFFHEGLLQ